MENLGTIVLTVVVVVAFTALLTYFSWRKNKQSWEGVVTELKTKRIERNRMEEDQPALYDEHVVIHYRTDAGGRGKFSLPQYHFDKHYPGLQVGERLSKVSGEDLPRRVGAA